MILSLCAFRRQFFAAVPAASMSVAEARQWSFQKLDALSRRVIRLRQFEKFSFCEIAELIGKPETETKAIWEEGLRRLRGFLASESVARSGQ